MKAYIINITFQDVTPIISRRVILPAKATFNRLHETIQRVTNFQSILEPYHYFAFEIDGLFITNSEDLLTEYKGKSFSGKKVRAANRLKIDSYLEQHQHLLYQYDFGDSWLIDITLEQIVEDYYFGYPTLLAAEGTAPPEDVGGVAGYESFLKIYHDPTHPEHTSMKNWAVHYRPPNLETINEFLKFVKYQKTEWQQIHHENYAIISDKYRAPSSQVKSEPANEQLTAYALAFGHLYGYIEWHDFLRIYNEQNEQQLTMKQLLMYLKATKTTQQLLKQGFHVQKDALLHDSLFAINLDVFKHDVSSKPFYIPVKEELLKYANPHYYEKTAQQETLAQVIVKEFYGGSTLMIQHDLDQLIFALQAVYCNFQQVVQQFASRYPFQSIGHLNQYVHLITHIGNTTRIWENRGHTPNELFEFEKAFLKPLPTTTASTYTVGRNEPCPCGSGKKFKKCCG